MTAQNNPYQWQHLGLGLVKTLLHKVSQSVVAYIYGGYT